MAVQPRDTTASESTTHLRRGEWLTRAIEHAEAVAAIEAWHYAQGAPNTSVARAGLFKAKDPTTLLGVAMWLPPTKNAAASVAGREWRRVLSLTRFVIADEVPTNGASFLLGAAMQQVDRARWPWLLSYADSAHGHTGAIYRATNWTYLGPWDAGDTWVHAATGEQRGRKRGGKNLSADEMRSLGFERQDQAVKHKFVHYRKATA